MVIKPWAKSENEYLEFESSVISYGNQTGRIIHGQDERLKVV